MKRKPLSSVQEIQVTC